MIWISEKRFAPVFLILDVRLKYNFFLTFKVYIHFEFISYCFNGDYLSGVGELYFGTLHE
jgi:hypothetical protein